MRKPTYKQLLDVAEWLLGHVMDSHNGNPPDYAKNCKMCKEIRHIKEVLKAAKKKKKKRNINHG
jgi:hypothetical protein